MEDDLYGDLDLGVGNESSIGQDTGSRTTSPSLDLYGDLGDEEVVGGENLEKGERAELEKGVRAELEEVVRGEPKKGVRTELENVLRAELEKESRAPSPSDDLYDEIYGVRKAGSDRKTAPPGGCVVTDTDRIPGSVLEEAR